MEASSVNSLIKLILLHQRNVSYLLKSETELNRSQLEILGFADEVVSFNPYQVQRTFKQMNLQQVRTSIRKLVDIKAIERLNIGARSKPAIYLINNKGREILRTYYKLWYNIIMPN